MPKWISWHPANIMNTSGFRRHLPCNILAPIYLCPKYRYNTHCAMTLFSLFFDNPRKLANYATALKWTSTTLCSQHSRMICSNTVNEAHLQSSREKFSLETVVYLLPELTSEEHPGTCPSTHLKWGNVRQRRHVWASTLPVCSDAGSK